MGLDNLYSVLVAPVHNHVLIRIAHYDEQMIEPSAATAVVTASNTFLFACPSDDGLKFKIATAMECSPR
jgi:hypothetical protein